MDFGAINWGVIKFVGPVLILIAIAWAIYRNKKSSQASIDRTERATHDLYRAEDRAHGHEDDKVP